MQIAAAPSRDAASHLAVGALSRHYNKYVATVLKFLIHRTIANYSAIEM